MQEQGVMVTRHIGAARTRHAMKWERIMKGNERHSSTGEVGRQTKRDSEHAVHAVRGYEMCKAISFLRRHKRVQKEENA